MIERVAMQAPTEISQETQETKEDGWLKELFSKIFKKIFKKD